LEEGSENIDKILPYMKYLKDVPGLPKIRSGGIDIFIKVAEEETLKSL